MSMQIYAAPDLNGESGYINMPDGRIASDGTFSMGYSFARPYSNLWSSLSILPRLELNARYVRIMNVPPGVGSYWQNYGDYKDKVAGGKAILLEEGWDTPSLALGVIDVQGTGLFKSTYLAASKQFGALDATLGAGSGRIDGVFGGMRYAPESWDGFAAVAEYDANNYKQDQGGELNGVANRKKGVGLALEYHWGWLGTQLSYRDKKVGINAYVSVPLNAKEFIPKIDEPPPDTEVVARPSFEQWNADQKYELELVQRLLDQDFKDIHLNVSRYTFEVSLTNTRISLESRAVGRAVRSILLRAPVGTREIRVNYTVSGMAFATYTFFDLEKLRGYFNGTVSRKQLAPYVAIQYADPQQKSDKDVALGGMERGYSRTHVNGEEGDVVSLRMEDAGLDKIKVAPGFDFYFNDPSGALRYETFLAAYYQKQVADTLFLKAATQLTLKQDVSAVNNPSNSRLPHVRSDVADYKKNGQVKLAQAVVNKYFHPEQRIYARASVGLYEEMFGGAGGQVLYYPKHSPWALDVSVDELKQRDIYGGLGFRNYSVMTALASVHYRLPIDGLTATVRGGRFLAGDEGARFEVKRQFRSGFQFGAWYTLTNGNDITTPGKPGKPYYDKGVFLTIPLASMLTRDNQAAPTVSISPWTRDVGQMVASPGDLYDMLEPAYNNLHDRDGLQYFGDLDDSYDMPREATVMDRIQWGNWADDRKHIGNALTSADTWGNVGLGLGIAALSSVVDKSADKWAARHYGHRSSKAVATIGNNLPIAAGVAAGLMSLDSSDQRLSATGFTMLESGVASVLAVEAGKYAFGRSRPQAGKGYSDFHFFKRTNSNAGFPSGHTAAMWAMVTPYAEEYHVPWLYGLAAVTNVARVADRQHFASDTVGGALLGYAIGDAFWRWHHEGGPRVMLDKNGVALNWSIN